MVKLQRASKLGVRSEIYKLEYLWGAPTLGCVLRKASGTIEAGVLAPTMHVMNGGAAKIELVGMRVVRVDWHGVGSTKQSNYMWESLGEGGVKDTITKSSAYTPPPSIILVLLFHSSINSSNRFYRYKRQPAFFVLTPLRCLAS